MVYKRVRIDLTEAQAFKALSGKKIRITAGQIGTGSSTVSLHPENAKIVERAALKKRGCLIYLSPGELADTAGQMQGGGFWGSLWSGIKKAWPTVLKPMLSAALDAGTAPLGAMVGQPALVSAARGALKKATGVGARKGRMTKAERMAGLQGAGLYLS